jgi:hypothetical protein
MFTSSLRAFHLLNRLDFADFMNYFSWQDGLIPEVGEWRSNPGSDRKAVVHRVSEVLLAAEITFCGLH